MKKSEVRQSIFVKLIFIIVLYGVLMNIAVVLFFKFSTEFKPKKFNRSFLMKMDEYVVNDIGFPPDTLKAKKLSADLNISIRYVNKNYNWATSNDVPALEELSKSEDYNEYIKEQNAFTVRYKDKNYGIIKNNDNIFILSYIPTQQEIFNAERAVFAIVVLLSAIFIPLYFLLRWLLNPLRVLSAAVKQIGDGNYDAELPVEKKDEFGELARALKAMSSRVRDSIRAKEQLLVDVSHELRTPLTRIRFGLELDTPKEKINEDLTEIENMIKKILEYYRNEYYFLQVNLNEIELVPLIENVISSYDLQKNRIDFLNYVKGKEKVVIKADEEKIKIAFRNLISNALKFSPENKNIIICLSETEKFFEVSFKDYGEGIEEDQIYKIFEPFSRVDSSRSKKTGGYGLGLAIVKKILDLHNASIEVKSKVDDGTEMIVKFKKG